MFDNGKIFKISSKYLLNDIFSFIEYNYALKLIKYNKKLQNFLDVKTQYFDYNIIKEKKASLAVQQINNIKESKNEVFTICKYFILFGCIILDICLNSKYFSFRIS